MTENNSGAGRPRDLISLIHFGWALAETRGRHRQLLTDKPSPPPPPARERHEYTLPLNHERSPKELTAQAQKEMATLAERLDLVIEQSALPYAPKAPQGTVLDLLDQTCYPTRTETNQQPEPTVVWMEIANVFRNWDTAVQDILAASSAQELAAYQLGRGLAEAYWSLDPTVAEDDARSWKSLLGNDRSKAIQRFIVQVSPAFDSLTVAAITGSLEAWIGVVEDAVLRQGPTTPTLLHEQIQRWHMILVDQVPPSNFVSVQRVLTSRGSTKRIIKTFAASATVAVCSLVVAIVGTVALLHFNGSAVFSFVFVFAGIFGITSAGVLAKAKDTADASLTHIREAASRAIVIDAVTLVPKETHDKKHQWKLQWPITRVPPSDVDSGGPSKVLALSRSTAAELTPITSEQSPSLAQEPKHGGDDGTTA